MLTKKKTYDPQNIFIGGGNGLRGILKIECRVESLEELIKYEDFWPHFKRL